MCAWAFTDRLRRIEGEHRKLRVDVGTACHRRCCLRRGGRGLLCAGLAVDAPHAADRGHRVPVARGRLHTGPAAGRPEAAVAALRAVGAGRRRRARPDSQPLAGREPRLFERLSFRPSAGIGCPAALGRRAAAPEQHAQARAVRDDCPAGRQPARRHSRARSSHTGRARRSGRACARGGYPTRSACC